MKRFKEIRIRKKLKLTDVAQALGVSQPTLSSWESGRKNPSIDMLLKMSELYGVTTDYLLGKDIKQCLSPTESISVELLPALHEKPIWITDRGWALVNSADNSVLLTNGERIEFSKIKKAVMIPDFFSTGSIPSSTPIPASKLSSLKYVWVEPISKDTELRQKLRGRYKIINGFAENEYGQRFNLSSYEATWLAFEIQE